QRVADRRADAALPHDRVRDGLAGVLVPEHRRLTLVGDADRLHVARGGARLLQAVLRDLQLARPDGFGVVLDVARLRIDLRELLLRGRDGRAVVAEQDRAARGRALVEGEDEAI